MEQKKQSRIFGQDLFVCKCYVCCGYHYSINQMHKVQKKKVSFFAKVDIHVLAPPGLGAPIN